MTFLAHPPVPPRITAGPSPLTVVVNEPVTLECNATGTPAPVLLWLKDSKPVPSMVAGGLQVRWLLMETEAHWGCPSMRAFPSLVLAFKKTIAGAEEVRCVPDLPHVWFMGAWTC